MADTDDTLIHPSACIASGARLGPGVRVAPFAVIEDDVIVGEGTRVGPHCVLRRWTRLGARNELAAHVVLGEAPQHRSYTGAETWLEIGDDNVIREGATINRAFEAGNTTRIGSRCFLMGYVHIAHDCVVGNDVTMANYVGLAGHSEVEDFVTIGGGSLVHQYVRVGRYAMIGGNSGVRKDILPFTLANGDPCLHYRLNSIGLRRQGFGGERYRALEQAMRVLRDGGGAAALEGMEETDDVRVLRAFLAACQRGAGGWAGRS